MVKSESGNAPFAPVSEYQFCLLVQFELMLRNSSKERKCVKLVRSKMENRLILIKHIHADSSVRILVESDGISRIDREFVHVPQDETSTRPMQRCYRLSPPTKT